MLDCAPDSLSDLPRLLKPRHETALMEFLNKLGNFMEAERKRRSKDSGKEEKRKRVFISYAWYRNEAKNERLQNWLRQFYKHLDAAGFQVYLDVKCIHGNLEEYMKKKVTKSDFILVICTPYFKERVEAEQASNVKFEMDTIFEQGKSFVPLIWEGNFGTSVPSNYPIGKNLALDFSKGRYIDLLTDIVNSRGLLPTLCNVHVKAKEGNVLDVVYPTFCQDLNRMLNPPPVQMSSGAEGAAGSGLALETAHMSGTDLYNKAHLFYKGKDFEKAWSYYELAVQRGEPKANTNLGGMLLNGDGRVANVTEAIRYFTMAANAGHARAMYNLGVVYETGQGGVAVDLAQAREWYKKGFEKGNKDCGERLKLCEQAQALRPGM